MLLPDIIRLPDVLPIISSQLGIHHIKILRSTCRELSMITNADGVQMSMSDTTAKYAHADRLQNGALRLKSRVGLHYADIHDLPGIRHLHPAARLPIVSMTYKGISFIGRIWCPRRFRDFIDARAFDSNGLNKLFHPASEIFSAGNIWINRLDQDSDCFDADQETVTLLELTLDRGYVVVDGGYFHLTIIFYPVFERIGDVIPSDSASNNKRAMLLSNGAFRFNTLNGEMSVDICSISGVYTIMMCYLDEFTVHRPLISMLYNGKVYVGREWGDGSVRSFTAFSESDNMFLPDSTVLHDLAGGVWISRLQHNVDKFHDGTLFTLLELTIDRGEHAEHGGEFRMQFLFTPI